jgi:molybdopterin-biosynthesis enzyme MoeA-like protein
VSAHQERFTGPAIQSTTLYTMLGEGDVADPLRAVAAAHPAVAIGSYPNTGATEPTSVFRVKLALTCRDADALAAAVAATRAALDVFER